MLRNSVCRFLFFAVLTKGAVNGSYVETRKFTATQEVATQEVEFTVFVLKLHGKSSVSHRAGDNATAATRGESFEYPKALATS